MSATIYNDYGRARVGWFFGLSGLQVGAVTAAVFPAIIALSRGAVLEFFALAFLGALTIALVVVPVKGRSATGWLVSLAAFTFGTMAGRTRFRSRAARGQETALAVPDLPGPLSGVEIHEGAPRGAQQARLAIIQNHSTRTWAMTAAIVHPGIGMADPSTRHRHGLGLAELIEMSARTELIDELLVTIRTVPDDGAERTQWVSKHRRDGGPQLARRINDELQEALSSGSVRTEAFVTFVVPEGRLAKEAKEAGGGLAGRAQSLYMLAGEVEAQLKSSVGMTEVSWLTSPALAAACRTGFAPGDRASIVNALDAAARDNRVNADVPWALAGPSGADSVVRHYSHDAWNSVSSTLKLPDKGMLMGALAPITTPTEPGERRSLVVSFPILDQARAETKARNSEWGADIADGLREKGKVKQRAREREDANKVRRLDTKLARGNALTQPYAVATVTVPKTVRAGEAGRRLDSSIRRAGLSPLRLDLAQDVAFAASTIPLGVSLARGTN